MTVVRPNSIAGINSITVQTGQALNIHDASGNLIRNITSSSGVSTFSSLHVGSGTTTNTQGISVGTGCSIVSGTVNTLEFYTNNNERLRIQADGGVAVGTNAVSAGDLATGTTIGNPKLHVDCGHLGNGAYHIARFRAGGDNDNNAAVLTLNHSNDRGLALYGGRSSGDRSWIALKSIDSSGRVTNAIEIKGDEGQGVQDLKFYTGDATTTTERLRIGPVGIITHTFVSDNSTTAEGFYINNTQNTTGNNASLVFSNDSGNRKKAAVSLIDTGNYGAGDLVFALDGADSGELHLTNDEKVRITSAGLVGINSATPNKQLEVQGLDVALRLKSTVATGRIGMEFYDTAAQKGFLGYPSSGNDQMSLQQNEAADFYCYVNGADRLRIRADGRTSIGSSLAVAGVTTAAAFIPSMGQLSHRNLIINGAMAVNQYGTSSTSSGLKHIDRWAMYAEGANTTLTQSKVDVAAGTAPYQLGFRSAFKILNAGQSNSNVGGDTIRIEQHIEDQMLARSGWDYKSSSSYLTLSFWVKSSVAQDFVITLMNRSDLGTSDIKTYSQNFTISSADTWTKITTKIPGSSSLTLDNDNTRGLTLAFYMFMGNDDTDGSHTDGAWQAYNGADLAKQQTITWWTTSNSTVEYTGVQLEVGEYATPFEHCGYDNELSRCMRYYYKLHNADGDQIRLLGYGGGGTSAGFILVHKPPMRDTPTGSLTANTFTYNDGTAAYTGSGGWSFNGNRFSTDVNTSTDAGSGAMTGKGLSIYSGGSGTSIELSAEL